MASWAGHSPYWTSILGLADLLKQHKRSDAFKLTMSGFPLPKVPMSRPGVELQLHPKVSRDCYSPSVVNPTLQGYLRRVKATIDDRQDDWDRYKKYTNPCEYVHTPVPGGKQAVCRLRPLSRSFYKMTELVHSCSLSEDLPSAATTFHFAEGPGGFIEALAYHRASHPDDKYYGMTLIRDSDPAVPGWKKSRGFLGRHPNVITLHGKDGTGDLFSEVNLHDIHSRFGGTADLVTGDGGFDFSMDFDRQESTSMRLIIAQLRFALAVQKKGGTFVLKVFDTFTQASVDFLYLLCSLYENVQAIKPSTSRQANSEKYLVCKGFYGRPHSHVQNSITRCILSLESSDHVLRLFSSPLPYYFITKVEELNAMLGQQQIESIAATLSLMDTARSERLESLRKSNVQKCIGWCQRHRLPYHRTGSSSNVFLGHRAPRYTKRETT